jgi:type I restriction enzyme S subunit
VDKSFLFYQLRELIAEMAASEHLHGSTMKHINRGPFLAHSAALPPLAEQRRIVAKLDALTARLARGRTELDRVAVLAARERKTVLTTAFSEANLKRWPSTTFDEAIAEGLIGLIRSKADQEREGTPYVRMNHYDLDGRINTLNMTHVRCSGEELRRYTLQPGDVLFNTRNSVELVGKVALWPDGMDRHVYNNNILRLRFRRTVSPAFAFRYMMSPHFRALMEQEKSATTTVAAIYQRSLYRASIPIPGLEEQEKVAAEINAAFARADRLEAEAARARALLDRLEAAILARAFRGELVPQDPNDEPASALLARIRAERAIEPKAKRRRQTREPSDA